MVDAIFSDLREMDKLHLKAKKLRILKGFLDRFPYMLDKTCTCDRIILGFIYVGMFGVKHKLWPDFYAIFKKNRRSITISEMQMIDTKLSLLFKIMLEIGHIPDKVYDALVFPKYEVSCDVYDLNNVI